MATTPGYTTGYKRKRGRQPLIPGEAAARATITAPAAVLDGLAELSEGSISRSVRHLYWLHYMEYRKIKEELRVQLRRELLAELGGRIDRVNVDENG